MQAQGTACGVPTLKPKVIAACAVAGSFLFSRFWYPPHLQLIASLLLEWIIFLADKGNKSNSYTNCTKKKTGPKKNWLKLQYIM
jgi:hypothetical protein